MVGATQHVGDAHVEIVDYDAEVICGHAVGAQQHEVLDFEVSELDTAEDGIVERGAARLRNGEADGGTLVVIHAPLRFFAAQRSAAIAWDAALGNALCALLLQLLFRAEAIVSMASAEQPSACGAIELHARS